MLLLFYGLISEQSENKMKSLRMRGHFIHMKPIEIVKSEYQRFLVDDGELISEQRFISKKHSSEIPIFFKMLIPNNVAFIESKCPKCGMKLYSQDHLSKQNAECPKCKKNHVLPCFNYDAFLEFKKDAFFTSEKFFQTKFATMTDNYQMCT